MTEVAERCRRKISQPGPTKAWQYNVMEQQLISTEYTELVPVCNNGFPGKIKTRAWSGPGCVGSINQNRRPLFVLRCHQAVDALWRRGSRVLDIDGTIGRGDGNIRQLAPIELIQTVLIFHRVGAVGNGLELQRYWIGDLDLLHFQVAVGIFGIRSGDVFVPVAHQVTIIVAIGVRDSRFGLIGIRQAVAISVRQYRQEDAGRQQTRRRESLVGEHAGVADRTAIGGLNIDQLVEVDQRVDVHVVFDGGGIAAPAITHGR